MSKQSTFAQVIICAYLASKDLCLNLKHVRFCLLKFVSISVLLKSVSISVRLKFVSNGVSLKYVSICVLLKFVSNCAFFEIYFNLCLLVVVGRVQT